MVFEGDGELVFETVAPVRVLGQELHGVVKAALKEMLGHLQALELMHGLHLLLTLSAGNVKSLILLLDAGYFTLHLLHPLIMGLLLALVVFSLEFANLLKLSFLFNFEQSLFN